MSHFLSIVTKNGCISSEVNVPQSKQKSPFAALLG
jgi:hypothetical protein